MILDDIHPVQRIDRSSAPTEVIRSALAESGVDEAEGKNWYFRTAFAVAAEDYETRDFVLDDETTFILVRPFPYDDIMDRDCPLIEGAEEEFGLFVSVERSNDLTSPQLRGMAAGFADISRGDVNIGILSDSSCFFRYSFREDEIRSFRGMFGGVYEVKYKQYGHRLVFKDEDFLIRIIRDTSSTEDTIEAHLVDLVDTDNDSVRLVEEDGEVSCYGSVQFALDSLYLSDRQRKTFLRHFL